MAYQPYEKIEFENAILVTSAHADLETGEVTMPVYSGKAPINATNLNHLENGIVNIEKNTIFFEEIGEIDEKGQIMLYKQDSEE